MFYKTSVKLYKLTIAPASLLYLGIIGYIGKQILKRNFTDFILIVS